MPGNLEWTNRAIKDMERLPSRDRDYVIRGLDRLAETRQGDIRQLHGPTTEWRLRVGDWRVRFSLLSSGNILILRVQNRREAYREC